MRRLVERVSLVLVAINSLFLIGIIGTLVLRWPSWTATVTLPTAALSLGPELHLPLAGMDGALFLNEEACMRLNGFLMEMARALGGRVPVSAEEIRVVVDSGQCSVGDPEVRTLIVAFRDAYQQAGLEPLSPFAVVD